MPAAEAGFRLRQLVDGVVRQSGPWRTCGARRYAPRRGHLRLGPAGWRGKARPRTCKEQSAPLLYFSL